MRADLQERLSENVKRVVVNLNPGEKTTGCDDACGKRIEEFGKCICISKERPSRSFFVNKIV